MRLASYLRFGAAVAVGALVVTVAAPQYRSTVLRVALFALAACVAVALVDATRRGAPAAETSPFEPGRVRVSRPEWPGELERLAVEVRAMAAGAERNAGVVPAALRRSCRRIAAARLSDRHGVDLDEDPARAAAVCGPELWAALDGEPTSLDCAGLVAALERL
jgi:hypothetical protein